MAKNTKTLYTASDARANFYTLLRDASVGVASFEITNKYGEAAVLMSKEEYDSWQETIDVLQSPAEMKAITTAKKQRKTVSHQGLLKELKVDSH
jgi:antitoxin YefM